MYDLCEPSEQPSIVSRRTGSAQEVDIWLRTATPTTQPGPQISVEAGTRPSKWRQLVETAILIVPSDDDDNDVTVVTE